MLCEGEREGGNGDEEPVEDLFWKTLIESHNVNERRGQ